MTARRCQLLTVDCRRQEQRETSNIRPNGLEEVVQPRSMVPLEIVYTWVWQTILL